MYCSWWNTVQNNVNQLFDWNHKINLFCDITIHVTTSTFWGKQRNHSSLDYQVINSCFVFRAQSVSTLWKTLIEIRDFIRHVIFNDDPFHGTLVVGRRRVWFSKGTRISCLFHEQRSWAAVVKIIDFPAGLGSIPTFGNRCLSPIGGGKQRSRFAGWVQLSAEAAPSPHGVSPSPPGGWEYRLCGEFTWIAVIFSYETS